MGTMLTRFILLAVGIVVVLAPAVRAEADPKPAPDRPLVVIPGILGSHLWIGGRDAWAGARSLVSLERLHIADGPRDSEPAPTCAEKATGDCGLLKEFAIVGPIKIGQYSRLVDYLQSIGYSQSGASPNLFVFTYDWRQSNFRTAEALKSFVDATPGLARRDFDILAHSMGGLVALIYATRYDSPPAGAQCVPGQCRIKTVITAGTPYFGSMNAVAMPIEGWGWLSRRLAGGADAIAATILSWPSFYELLPTYENCCGDNPTKTMAEYETFAQLPYAARLGGSSAAVRAALERRRELDRMARDGWPRHIAEKSKQCEDDVPRERLYVVVGDRIDTRQGMTLLAGSLKYTERRGDGTVLLRSASANRVSQSWLSFAPHSTMLDDKNVQTKLEHILLRCHVDTVDFAAAPTTVILENAAGGVIEANVESVSAKIVQGYDRNGPIMSAKATLTVAASLQVRPPVAWIEARIGDRELLRSKEKPVQVEVQGVNRHFLFESPAILVPDGGLVELKVTFPGGISVADQAMAF